MDMLPLAITDEKNKTLSQVPIGHNEPRAHEHLS
jgi:hypothetical protein